MGLAPEEVGAVGEVGAMPASNDASRGAVVGIERRVAKARVSQHTLPQTLCVPLQSLPVMTSTFTVGAKNDDDDQEDGEHCVKAPQPYSAHGDKASGDLKKPSQGIERFIYTRNLRCVTWS